MARLDWVWLRWGLAAMGIAFVVLKLLHVIDWSWFWVTAPFWLGIAIMTAIVLCAGLVIGTGVVAIAITDWNRKRKRTKGAKKE